MLLLIPATALANSPAAGDAANTAIDQAEAVEPVWPFEISDLPVDPAYTFGQLDNGMRYIVRENATPEGTALVRFYVGAGSLDETDSERGLAHYVEHMAFNGSNKIPEGEMVKLLEREGLAFGADTNASTGFDATTYMLNLPRNDEALLDTALMLMRETASELTITPEAVERERGIILAERRDRRTFSFKETEDRFAFAAPEARFVERFPIGTLDVLENATAEDLQAFYERNYVPENAVLIIIGNYPVDVLESKIAQWFADWAPGEMPVEPQTGPVDIERRGETDIYVDPALSERVSLSSYQDWIDRPDTVENRRQSVLRAVGYGIINRRLASLARSAEAPFRSAGYGTSDFFEDARSTSIIVDTADGDWQTGVNAAVTEVRRAYQFGFTESEVAEQIARLRTSLENAAKSSATRTNSVLVNQALSLVADDRIPTSPSSGLERFESYASSITPESALAAIEADAAELTDPLIRFRGRAEPVGGALALRNAWSDALAVQLEAPEDNSAAAFAYTDFGEPGEVISDTEDERFGFRLIRFANGVRLNLKQSDIRQNQIRYSVTLDGGNLLNTSDDPLKTALVSAFTLGGLGQHSQDELETVLAGRDVRLSMRSSSDHFSLSGGTNPEDLDLQLQLLAAALTDPGYRKEGEQRYARRVEDWFARLDATPSSALSNRLGAILSDDHPRFSLQSKQAYLDRSFDQLRQDIGDRLERGAIEIALVGDFDPDAAIAAVAKTLGALPTREAEFLLRSQARTRPFTADRSLRTLTHSGEPDQALVRMTWPTTDDKDLAEAVRLALLNRVVKIKLQEQLREELGQAYSPSSSSNPSRVYDGYGTFVLASSVDVSDVQATRAAIMAMLTDLRTEEIDDDLLSRARQPILEQYDNLLKSLGGWMTLADRAQSEAYRLERFFQAPQLVETITPADILAMAQKYLDPGQAVEIIVLPETSPSIVSEIAEGTQQTGPEPEGPGPDPA